MRSRLLPAAALLAAVSSVSQARADVAAFGFSGGGVSGSVVLTYGPDAVVGDPPGAYVITNASGTFSDLNIGIAGAAITGVAPSAPASPEPTNLLAPKSFGFYPITSGVPAPGGASAPGFAYDDLFYPGGSPQTASDYPFHGGFLDIYGAVFTIAGNRAVNLWSDGDDGTGLTYGVGVTDGTNVLDYVFSGVAVPEPGSFGLFGIGLLSALAWRRRGGATV
ncbi:MAG TPA: PEP-CTERM sorting domain-containing protein [Acetobacteraceae bacterium]